LLLRFLVVWIFFHLFFFFFFLRWSQSFSWLLKNVNFVLLLEHMLWLVFVWSFFGCCDSIFLFLCLIFPLPHVNPFLL
jgi:hypothetical protein